MKVVLDNLISKCFLDHICCPHCHKDTIMKNGKYKEKQRYICKACGKNFNTLTNTPMSMSHKLEKWPIFIECVIKGLPLRASAKETGVSYVTLFYWRHKLMKALRSDENNSFDNHVEAEDTFLTHSEKGGRKVLGRKPRKAGTKYYMGGERRVFLLVAADHSGQLFIKASAPRNSYTNIIYELLGDKVSPNAVFCSGPKSFYKHFAKSKNIKQHFSINYCNRTEEHNIDLAKGWHKGIKAWLDKYKGVASKYLNNYLSLFKCLYKVLYKSLSKSDFDKTEIGIMSIINEIKYANEKVTYKNIKELELA